MARALLHLRSHFSRKFLFAPLNPFSSSPSISSPIPFQFPPLSCYFSKSSILQRKHVDGNDDVLNSDPYAPPKLFVVQPRIRPQASLKTKLEEALNLANSLEQQRDGFYDTEFSDKEMPPHVVVQNPAARAPRADTYFGAGTVDTVKCHINDLDSKDGVDAIFVNAILTGVQQRNLERTWGKPVLDRVGLIIEIFHAHAQTKEAKLQAELAALMYKRSRLVRVRGLDGRYTFGGVAEAEVVSARGRGSGGRGFISGAGETELQLQRRRISERRKKLLAEIQDVRRTRAMQRAARRRQGGMPGQEISTVAVVGYTNAGKSTLVSALSNSYMYCDDRLFATVDPKLSNVTLPSGRKVLLSDTVGFISDLPVQLVEAFHATLEEVVEADLLMHVLDSNASNLDEHRNSVMQVLVKLGVSQEKLQNMIEVWNKVDLLDKEHDVIELDDGDLDSSLSGEEDVESSVNQLTDLHMETEPIDNLENVEEVDCSDDWLSGEDDEGRLLGYENVRCQQNELSEVPSSDAKGSRTQSDSNIPVKVSAITGVGLQELLELIDEKLGPCKVVERSIFERKWRPLRTENDEISVEQIG